jgi:hypothetical protein
MPERTPQERVERGRRLQQLLADPLLIEVFEAVEREALAELLEMSDPVKRDLAWHRYHATREVRNVIERTVADGQYAAAELAKVGL